MSAEDSGPQKPKWLTREQAVERYGVDPSKPKYAESIKSKLVVALSPGLGTVLVRLYEEGGVQYADK